MRFQKIPRRGAFVLMAGLVLWGVGAVAWQASRPCHPVSGSWQRWDITTVTPPPWPIVITRVHIRDDGTFRKTVDGKVSTGTWKPVEAWASIEPLTYEAPDTPNVGYIVPKYVSSERVNSNPHLRKLWEQGKFHRCPEAYEFVTADGSTDIAVPEDGYRKLDSFLVDWNLERQSPWPEWLTRWLAKVRRAVQP